MFRSALSLKKPSIMQDIKWFHCKSQSHGALADGPGVLPGVSQGRLMLLIPSVLSSLSQGLGSLAFDPLEGDFVSSREMEKHLWLVEVGGVDAPWTQFSACSRDACWQGV